VLHGRRRHCFRLEHVSRSPRGTSAPFATRDGTTHESSTSRIRSSEQAVAAMMSVWRLEATTGWCRRFVGEAAVCEGGQAIAYERATRNAAGSRRSCGARTAREMSVVQVSFHLDAQQRDAESLLRAWPTLMPWQRQLACGSGRQCGAGGASYGDDRARWCALPLRSAKRHVDRSRCSSALPRCCQR
jgi:hypothetical protein